MANDNIKQAANKILAGPALGGPDIPGFRVAVTEDLPELTNGSIWIGDLGNRPQIQTISGDITIGNTGIAAISAGVIIDADVNAAAGISVSKLAALTANRIVITNASGFISAADTATYPNLTELANLKNVTAPIQTQINNKVTKGGDTVAFSFGTTVGGQDVTVKLGNSDRWVFDGTNGYLRRGSTGTADFGLHLFGTGAGAVLAFGDRFDATTPYVCVREYTGADTDQIECYGQKGAGLRAGIFGTTTPQIWITQSGDVGINNMSPGKPFSVVGNSYINGALTVGPTDNTSAQLSVTTSAANTGAFRYTDGTNYTISGGYQAANVGFFGATAGSSLVLRSNGTETIRLSTANKVSIGTGAAATAFLHLTGCVAGASGASLKINSGTLGDIENGEFGSFDGTNFYCCTNGARFQVAKILTASAILNFPNTLAQTYSDLTMTLTGAALGDCVALGIPNGSVPTKCAGWFAWVSNANTVTVRYFNAGLVADDPPSGTFKVTVIKNL